MIRSPIVFAVLGASLFALPGCDLFRSGPAVNEVLLIGTRVSLDFLDTGAFEIVATPLDEEGASILDEGVEAEVAVATPGGVDATAQFGRADPASDQPLRVALVIDESGSMRDTDPLRLRVAGAIDFVEHLAQTPGLDWQAAVYSYSSNWQMRAPFLSDLTRLRQGIEQIGASGGTNTYYALRKTLFEFASGPRSAPSLRKAIVLFSDGQPNDAHRRDEVCQEAVRLGVPIFAIGLGPASDLSPDADPAAVEEMRAIANCTGAAYAGIAPNDPTAIQRIYVSIATAAAQGSLTYDVTLSGPGFEALQPGQRVEGRLQLSSGGASASASFQFTVPPATAAHFTSHPVSSVGE